MALLQHYEGDAQRDRVKDAAYSTIANTKYYGEKKKFSFETYVNLHQEAWQDLNQNGEVISAEKCVRDLLAGIVDENMKASKAAVLASPHLRNDFDGTVAYLMTTLQLTMTQTSHQARSIYVSHTSRFNRGGHNHRGGG
jgi:hypothetical protein